MSERAQEILEPNIVNGDLDDDVVVITTAGLIGDLVLRLCRSPSPPHRHGEDRWLTT